MSFTRWRVLCLMLLCLNGIATAQQLEPALMPAACPAKARAIANEHRSTLHCAWFLAPEDRQKQQNGSQVELFVLRILSQEPKGNAPLLHLTGGPGDAASDELAFWLTSGFHQDYDIILMDQRGTGLSRPALACPESASDDQWILACRMRLVNEGIDLSAYHSMAIVRDTRDLLEAMAIEKVNVYGSSFGSRLALLLADVAPERIRSLALDGAYPPPRSALVDMAHNSEQALERLFSDCESNPSCDVALPELRRKFYHVLAELNEEPLELYNLDENTVLRLNGDEFLLWTIDMLQYPDLVPLLPLFIELLHLGNTYLLLSLDSLAKAPNRNEDNSHSDGAYLSVLCAEDMALAASERWRTQHQQASQAIRHALRPIAREQISACEKWDLRPAGTLPVEVVKSDVPALLLSGAYDSVTPPYYGELAAEHLRVSWHYLFPNVGHNVLKAEPCASAVMRTFLADPTRQPAHQCFATLQPPDFALERAG